MRRAGSLLHPDGRLVECTRSESVIVPPAELYGKTTQFVLAGIRKGLIFPLFDTAAMSNIEAQISAVILSFVGEAASSNRRMLNHFVGKVEADCWPTTVLLDPGQVCLLHQVHRIKVKLVDVHCQVSLMYCLSNLVRARAVLHLVADNIAERCARCERIVGPPPPEAAAKARRLMSMIYRLDATHHTVYNKKGAGKSMLVKDVEAVLHMDNGGLGTGAAPLVHYCCGADGRPCCRSQQETVDKLTGAYLNLYMCHGMPSATLSRWTHVQVVCGILCSAFACRDVFVQALLHGLPVYEGQEDAANQGLEAAAAGAGDEDKAREHRARVSKVRRWLQRPEFKWPRCFSCCISSTR